MKIITEETIKHYSRDHKERVPVIEAVNVGVKYNLGRKRDDIQSLSYRLISRERWRYKEFWALKGLTFTGYNGDILGVIGANGAGKTTLCRVISGLLKPDTGRITVNGSVTALFSLGIGFNQQLTGRENIFLNGYMLGFSHAEMNKLLPQIISFTGLGRFIDEPLKRYSSGMRARLGFSIAAMLEPEILVLDEALSAGDLAFNEKAALKMQELVARAKMVVIVSHQTDFIEKHCNRALWIDQGTLRACGKPGEVVAAYKESVPAWQRTKSRKIKLVKTKTTISSERVITVQGVGVKFLLSKKENSPGYTGSPGKGFFWALKDLSFTVNAGEIVGIIGANGAGKTTLCRVLTGILKPDTGAVSIKGSTTALLSLGTGFNSQLSGRDNILLNGLML
ncbi:MAG TPA: ATP-binding cassette domain-containing protein, partial [Bacillota bacterium]|nr:ATP-binding cassette domain-containing protein [Bacillota bacterium]